MAKIEGIKGRKAIKDGSMTIASNVVNEPDEDWDVQVSFTVEECAFCCTTNQKDELALTRVNTNHINYNVDWIIDSECSNHMTGDKRKLTNLTESKGGQVVVTADNSRLPITYIGNATILPRYNSHQVELQHVYHVPGMKKNLLSVSQLTASGNFVLFRLDEVRVYQNKKITGTLIMQGKWMETVYVMSVQETYVDKARKNETVDLWHARLGHRKRYTSDENLVELDSPLESIVGKSTSSSTNLANRNQNQKLEETVYVRANARYELLRRVWMAT
ncbi:hypothetical protein ACH5RR_007378 [Cinchona calisaya]|uniref:Retrovirus-related Pol polyprotein from transposon TNT 1-94-like beta-barrel domain-containing protein n=1 Tax=Cinchona calisaya TaxID=153742 RepID=A0ABD3ARL2_9GENT